MPNVYWNISGPFDRVALTIDETTVYADDTRCGEGRWRDLRRPGTHRLRLTVGYGDHEVVASSFCTALLEGDEPALMPMIGYFYPETYVGQVGVVPTAHWSTRNITSLEIWVDGQCVHVSEDEDGKIRLSQLRRAESHIVHMVAHNAIDDIPVFIGDGKEGSGRWLDVSGLNSGELLGSHEVSLSVSNAYGTATSNFTCACHWEEPPPPPMGSEENPWQVGDDVQAYTNGVGGLAFVGAGATSNFTGEAGVPTVAVEGGTAYLGVSVRTNAYLNAATGSWGAVKFDKGTEIGLSADGTELIVPVPANAKQGFMTLWSTGRKEH